MKKGKSKSKPKRKGRRLSLKAGLTLLVLFAVWGGVGDWYVHHTRAWLAEQPALLSSALMWIGNPVADITDGLDLTGYDTVCEYDTAAPVGSVFFAGAPVQQGWAVPRDVRVVQRGEFAIGWSDTLRHPVWCAYHVTREAKHESGKRPSFTRDKSLPRSPSPNAYSHSGYDRGHLVPNHAIVTRYGEEEQKKTFAMSNVAPQMPSLNRGVWRDVEHRIADLWTARYGEIWVVVGCVSDAKGRETIGNTGIDVPRAFYQIIMAQEGMDVRALAVLFDKETGWGEWAARHIVTIDEIEQLTGLDFNPELPLFIQDPLESDLPTRLWPVRGIDIFKQIALRFQ